MSRLTDSVQDMAEAAASLAEHWRQGGGAQREAVLSNIAGMKPHQRCVLVGWIAGCLDAAGEDAAVAEWLTAALPGGAA